MGKRTRHMHTVPRGVPAGVLRIRPLLETNRTCGGLKGNTRSQSRWPYSNVSVSTDIYTLWTETGIPDTTIRTKLFDEAVEEHGFPALAAWRLGNSHPISPLLLVIT